MNIVQEWQEEPEDDYSNIEKSISDITNQWKNGTTGEDSYHGQLALLYSIAKNAPKCREHAALVSADADEFAKGNAGIAVARILIFEKKLPQAIEAYEQLLTLDEEHDAALEEIGWCCYEEKRYAEAAKYFDRLIAIDDECHWVWEAGGLVASQQKKYNKAIGYFIKALEHDEAGNYTATYQYYIGLSYERQHDFYRALSHYTKSLDADPTFAESLNNMAKLYFEHEADIQTAIKYLDQAEAIAEETGNENLLQLICINMTRLYKLRLDYDKEMHYKQKLFALLGLSDAMSFDDDDEEEE